MPMKDCFFGSLTDPAWSSWFLSSSFLCRLVGVGHKSGSASRWSLWVLFWPRFEVGLEPGGWRSWIEPLFFPDLCPGKCVHCRCDIKGVSWAHRHMSTSSALRCGPLHFDLWSQHQTSQYWLRLASHRCDHCSFGTGGYDWSDVESLSEFNFNWPLSSHSSSSSTFPPPPAPRSERYGQFWWEWKAEIPLLQQILQSALTVKCSSPGEVARVLCPLDLLLVPDLFLLPDIQSVDWAVVYQELTWWWVGHFLWWCGRTRSGAFSVIWS